MSRMDEESPSTAAGGPTGSGPLAGVTLLELGGIGPLPLLAMLFADLGARVIRVDPVNPSLYRISTRLWIFRGHESVTLDLGQDEGREVLLRLVEHADILVEGYRAGVAERLGVGPEECLARNPRLVYGRMTGWGSSGPLADKGGHDINYMAITGALQAIGPKDAPPPPPLNLVADFGGGGMMLAMGVLAALHEREQSGRGQVVESAMSDGVLGLMSLWFAIRDTGSWNPERGVNQIQGGAPFYRCYETSDGEYMAVGAVERKFYAALIDGLGLDAALVEVAGADLGVRRGVPDPDPRRVGGHLRRAGRVRHARAHHGGGDAVPAQHRTGRLRRGQRLPPGRSPGAVRAYPGLRGRAVTRSRRRHRTDPDRARLRPTGDREAPGNRRYRVTQ
jgi:alpha-methylacyl-CoA racemase